MPLMGYGQTATFLSNFEDQNTDPEIGVSVRTETGTSGGMYVVPNPHPDARNSSDYVLKQYTEPGTGGRAEYSAGRFETNKKKYIYTWKRFHPSDMFTDIKITGWVSLNQWKTWPCEYYGSGEYDFSDEICYGGGIFNDIRYQEPGIIDYISRAAPDCNVDYGTMPKGYWNDFVLEIYWTNTDNGYYRIWRNDTLFGYSDNIKTLFDGFLEGTCDVYWSTGLYTYWDKTGGETADSLIAYIDDVVLYDSDSGYTISDICPDCEAAPFVPTDSNVYKINLQGSYASNGYTNIISSWAGDTNAINLSNTFGQSNGIDIYLWSGTSESSGSLDDACFPDAVINKCIYWGDTETHQIYLKDLIPANTYTFKLLGATPNLGTTRGTQIWTTDENRDTVFAASNTCDMAEITNLVSDANGDLTINVKTIGGTAYINSIEIIEYAVNENTSVKNTMSDELYVFPNPVSDKLFIKSETVPSKIILYSCTGRKVKYAQNTSVVDVSDLNKGVYIVLVSLQESVVVSKIIKD
jgi:hypothetical protein